MKHAVVVQGLGKRYFRYHQERPLTLQEVFQRGLHRLRPVEHFWALRGVEFNVDSGHTLGIIGGNGSGKSTLLRLIGGLGRPEEGTVQINGRLGALLELGVGFHPDLSGRENIFITGVIAGLTRQEVAEKFDSIIEFAELEQFVDMPLRTYSTGMQMRLSFAVAVHTRPDILLIDEVLTVGDLRFQRKCIERIAQFKAEGCTIFLVSHDTVLIRQLCDQVLWLRQGKVAALGNPELVVGQYVAEMMAETRRRTPATRPPLYTPSGVALRLAENRFGSLELEIVSVRLRSAAGYPVNEIASGDELCIDLEYFASQPIDGAIFGVTITREDGYVCYDTNTATAGITLPPTEGRGRITLHLDRLDLIGGEYFVDVGAYERDWTYAYDYHWRVYPLQVIAPDGEKGIVRPPHRWEVGVAGAV